jgi:aspartyl/asparaginyl beta-hydroxylase (cupin superfamily)
MFKINSLNYKISRFFCKFIIINSEKIFKLYKINKLPNFDIDFKKSFLFLKKEILEYLNYNLLQSASNISQEQLRIENKHKWKVLVLKLFNIVNVKNCNNLPKLYSIIKKHKNIKSVIVSKLEPNSHIKPHRGVFNGLVRYHFGIKIPKDKEKTFLKLNGEKKYWKEGDSFIFDDTEYHEAVNDSEEDRIIIMVDYERPLPWFLKPLNKFIIYIIKKSPLIQNSIENMENFNK